ncbi:triose-phosphate transporter [Colletotrichum sublineola]|uniref:Putative triose-phosphate transporter n=1 Tax=Colletotrichum sublineola TaxID=1173701 RepID=A0A066X5F1_COLSU|nr:triose-phosphate transporter [Colletotrichum sublineola]KDN61210.1 putative triose-phosphate transporter [Colletotrichum sublineola]
MPRSSSPSDSTSSSLVHVLPPDPSRSASVSASAIVSTISSSPDPIDHEDALPSSSHDHPTAATNQRLLSPSPLLLPPPTASSPGHATTSPIPANPDDTRSQDVIAATDLVQTYSHLASASTFTNTNYENFSPTRDPVAEQEFEMEPLKGAGHRRRRSSLMQNAGSSNHQKTPSRTQGNLPEEPKISEEDFGATPSASKDAGNESFSDEDLHDDEEMGLTKKDKNRKKKKRRNNTRLDQRIVRGEISAEEKKEADQNVFRRSIINVVLILLWYFFSLSISLYNKWMFDQDRLNFAFPLFTTACHMLVQFTLASLVLFLVPSLRPSNSLRNSDLGRSRHESEPDRPLMTKMFYLTRIGPCGAATGLDIGLGNTSLKFITLTFYTMCKSSSLAFVLIFAFLFRLEQPTWRLVAIIATMTLGVVLMVSGEVEFKVSGFILVISAAFFSGFRWGLTQILLLRNPATSNPFSSIFFLAPVMFLTLIIIAIPVEGFPALIEGLKVLIAEWGAITTPLFLLFPGCIAFLMTASEFALLQRTSVVTLSIAGIFKEVVTISAAALVFNDRLTPINFVGLITTMGAIVAYNYIKITQMREDAQREVQRGHLEVASGSSSSGSDNDDGGEETGLLRNSTEYEDNLVTADGDILPNPQHTAQELRTAQAHRDN